MAIESQSYIGAVDTPLGRSLVGSALFGSCDTTAATAAKVVKLNNFDYLMDGITIHVKFTYSNTASSATLTVGSTAARPIYMAGTTAPGTNANTSWPANSVVSFTYVGDATSGAWYMNDHISNTDSDTKVTQTVRSNSANYPLLLAPSGQTSTQTTTANFATVFQADPSTGNLQAPKFNDFVLAAACAKAVDTAISSTTSTNLPTSAAVATYVTNAISSVAGGLTYQGTVSAASDMLSTALVKGYMYVADTDFTLDGEPVRVGDYIIVNVAGTYSTEEDLAAAVDIIQGNIDRIEETEITAAVNSVWP